MSLSIIDAIMRRSGAAAANANATEHMTMDEGAQLNVAQQAMLGSTHGTTGGGAYTSPDLSGTYLAATPHAPAGTTAAAPAVNPYIKREGFGALHNKTPEEIAAFGRAYAAKQLQD